MKKYLYFPGLAALVLFAAWLSPLTAQNQQTSVDASAQFLPLLQSVTEQQTALIANQALIEASVTRIGEEVRQARIYAARSASGKGAAK